MENLAPPRAGVPRRPGRRSLAQKYSIFTSLLLSYVIFLFIGYDIWADSFNPMKASILAVSMLLIAGAISKYTNRLLARPLRYLQQGITAVRQGRLEPIQVSRTGDEIEFVGDSFNDMIEALSTSRAELQQYQESLEELVRQRTRALETVSEKAVAASRAKSEFLANMSHELRTPMSGVLGMIDIVMDSDLDHEQREQLITAKACANSLLQLLNDILDLSKIEAGKMVIEEVEFEPETQASECARMLRTKAAQKDIDLRMEIAPGVPRRVVGDPLRIRQVLFNLLSNAVKFTATGFVELRVEPDDTSTASDPVLVFKVKDTGTGIPPEKLTVIFEEFTQADGSISRRYGGTGLGLTITRRLVEMQGGHISVESQIGRGSVFSVTIPFKAIHAPEAVIETSATGETEQNGDTTSCKATILVVEDNTVNQKVISAMLRRHGYRVIIACHGGEVLPALEREQAALILMDVQMPMVDGIEATRLVRQHSRWCNLPIIAMTAHAMHGDRDQCLKEGMDGYLSKPINRPQLIQVIEEQLVERRSGAPSSAGRPGKSTSHAVAPLEVPSTTRQENLVEH